MTLLLRISSALDVYGALGIDGDVFFTLSVQLLIFGLMPVSLYMMFAAREQSPLRKGGRFLGTLSDAASDFGFRKPKAADVWRTLAIGLIMVFTATGFSYFWQVVLYYTGFTAVSSPTDYSSLGVLFAELALTALLPAIFEEITHRGLLFAGYRDSGAKVVLVSALLFSLMHQNIRQTGYTFYDGVIMALVVYYTRSIYMGMLIHFLNNAIAVIEGYIAQNGGIFDFVNKIADWMFGSLFGILCYIILAAGLILLMVVLFRRMRGDAVRRGDISPNGKPSGDAIPLRRDAYFIATVVIGVIATVFSYVWGMLR
jgi:membrane protease YdiL (CAAX protease family)